MIQTFLFYSSSETLYDCLVIGCLRRVQEWSFTSILSEFRQLCWPLRLNDFEQFIESFNVSLVVTEENVPDYLLTHDHLKVLSFSTFVHLRPSYIPYCV